MRYLPYFLLPFSLSLIFTPLVRYFAVKNNFVALPRADRWHNKPTALLGGISIYFASLFSVLLMGGVNKSTLILFIGATFLFIMGIFDEKIHFKPYTKLFAQVIAGCIAILFGVVLGFPKSIFLAIPLTLLWIIGITNSLNLLDNIDGLSAGIAAIASLMLFFSSLFIANNPLSIFCLILCGASLGFLPYNFNPAKIFMGDSGSMFLGYSLALISISGATRHVSNLLITMMIPVLILSVPIFDTAFVIITRKLMGRKIFEGGKDHTSHRLTSLGLSPKKTVFLLYFISIVFSLIALSYSKSNIFIVSVITFLAAVILLFFGLFLFERTSHDDKRKVEAGGLYNPPASNTALNNIFLYKRRIVEVLLDLSFICVAYYSAYFLRFESGLLVNNLALIKESLAGIILINMTVFFIFGLYRGVWRHISIPDFFTIFKVVTLGSILSIIFLTFAFRFRDYSRAVLFINWLVLLFLITGSRFMFRIFGEFFTKLQEQGKNVLIYGAGDMGEMVIREIRKNKKLRYIPVGFIDDDIYKTGNKIHGIPVLGTRYSLEGIILKEEIKEIVIAISSISTADFLGIVKICKNCGISYRRVCGIFDDITINEINERQDK